MRIVLVNQFYPPDVAPTGLYLHDFGKALVQTGHRVEVLASRHAYTGGGDFAAYEVRDGVEVHRLPGFAFGRTTFGGKLADYAAYYARLGLALMRRGPVDLIVSLTTPPFIGLLGKSIAMRTGARHVHWIMDLYPDVLEAHGLVAGPALAGLRGLARFCHAGASAVVTLGPAMAERAQRYADPSTRVTWVPLWSPDELAPWPEDAPVPLRSERGWSPGATVLLYSGNLGLGHRFGEFLATARQLGRAGPIWAFAGQGRARPEVERFAAQHAELPLQLLPYVSADRLREHLCSADVHLISMDARWEGTLLPSKLQASFAVGKPVIFVGARTQDMARWVADSGGGWVVEENDVAGLRAAVSSASDPAERKLRGARGRAYAEQHFGRDRNVAEFVRLSVGG